MKTSMKANGGSGVASKMRSDTAGREGFSSKEPSLASQAKESFESATLDPANALASRSARMLVFVLLCQGVQMFMSYDGGAVPASLPALEEMLEGSWSQFEVGILGGMDKFGMVVASVPWGWALRWFNAKLLLTVSLLLNALCTAAYGSLRQRESIYLAKFLMGVTQSLQGVWGTVWTVNMAPPDKKTMWLGLGAISAGIGNGIGTAVAGFGLANGMSYDLIFQLAAAVLFLFWLVLLFLPRHWIRMELPDDHQDGLDKTTILSDSENPSLSTVGGDTSEGGSEKNSSIGDILDNKVFLWTTLLISLAMFEVSAIQYLFMRVFMEIWAVAPGESLNQNWVTVMFLLVTGIGGGLGVAFGPWLVDRRGGFHKPAGVYRTLKLIAHFQAAAAVAGIGGVVCLYGKMHVPASKRYSGEWGDEWIWLIWGCIFFIYLAHNAGVAALCGISVQVIPESSRTFASGIEMTFRNVLGFICAPVLPAMVMSLNSGANDPCWELSLGIGFVFLANCFGIGLVSQAIAAAREQLDNYRFDALQRLREAFQSEDVEALQRSVVLARHVDLSEWRHGTALATIDMANEAIGRFRAESRHGCGSISQEPAQQQGQENDFLSTASHIICQQTWLGSTQEQQLEVVNRQQRQELERQRLEILDLREQLFLQKSGGECRGQQPRIERSASWPGHL
jgi:MFS family permease